MAYSLSWPSPTSRFLEGGQFSATTQIEITPLLIGYSQQSEDDNHWVLRNNQRELTHTFSLLPL
ncbi:hypothetical protein JHK87_021445 [Glycine soja]|nr:hypothetical protein JHK87_021445 [Glycine soja]